MENRMTRNIWDHERKQLLKDITSECGYDVTEKIPVGGVTSTATGTTVGNATNFNSTGDTTCD